MGHGSSTGDGRGVVVHQCLYTPPHHEVVGGYIGLNLSVRLSVCGQHRVRSVSFTIILGSISYSYTLSSNFRRCVACWLFLKIPKFEYLPIFSCDQAALRTALSVRPSVRLSVCPSVRLSVCHTFLTMFPSLYHHEIFRSYYHGQKWCPRKRSRSEVKGQSHRGHDPTWPFPDSNSSLNSRMATKFCTQLEPT